MTIVDQLQGLEASGLVRLATTQPELAYAFRHTLVHHAAYESLTRQDRKQLHRAVGQALEALYAGRLEELAPLLAEHFDRAGDEARALRYFTLAADAAARVYANAEAVLHYGRAQEIVKRTRRRGNVLLAGREIVRLYTARSRALELLGDFGIALANDLELEQLGQELDDPEMSLAGLSARASIYSRATDQFDPQEGKTLLLEALGLARELSDPEAEAKILWSLMLLHFFIGQMEPALWYGEQSLQIAREGGFREQVAFTLNDLAGYMYLPRHEYERGLQTMEEARAIWRELGNLPMLADNLNTTAFNYLVMGQFDRAEALAQEAYEVSQPIGNLWGQGYSRGVLGLVHLERGDLHLALPDISEAIRLGEQVNGLTMQVIPRNLLAFHYGLWGAVAQGIEIVRQLQNIRQSQSSFWLTQTMGSLALLHVLNGDLEQAETLLRQTTAAITSEGWFFPRFTVAIAEFELGIARGEYDRVAARAADFARELRQGGSQALVPYLLYYEGKAAWKQRTAQTETAAALGEARAVAEAIGARSILWRILALLAEVEAERGKAEEARTLRAQARELVGYLADHMDDPEVRELFLGLAEVRAITLA